MERYAITFDVKPGSEEAVATVLGRYARPETTIDDDTRLLRTTVFMHGTTVVRVVDIEGFIGTVMAHLARQPEVQEVERQLNEHLAEPRDLDDPAAARDFFMRATMQLVTHRSVPGAEGRTGSRHALLYPVRPGHGDEVDAVVRGGGDPPPQAGERPGGSPPPIVLLGTTVFRKGDLVVRMFEIDGALDDAAEHLSRSGALLQAGRQLQHLLDTGVNLSTSEGMRRFLREQSMTVVTDRVAGVPLGSAGTPA